MKRNNSYATIDPFMVFEAMKDIVLSAMQRAVEEKEGQLDKLFNLYGKLGEENTTHRTELESYKEKVAELSDELFEKENNPDYKTTLTHLRTELERVKQYARHMSNCAWRYNGNGVCTCGLEGGGTSHTQQTKGGSND